MSEIKNPARLVELGQPSQLKVDLNRGIASLTKAAESHFQPHVCLNGPKGVEIIRLIAENPDGADTNIAIRSFPDGDGRDLWLNVSLSVFLGKLSSESYVTLSPRQAAYVVTQLPAESKRIVVEHLSAWFGEYRLEMQKGLEMIARQFATDRIFVADAHENRIFDIHGPNDSVEYSECGIIGNALFYAFFFGLTLFDRETEGYERIDGMLREIAANKKNVAEATFSLLQAIR